MVNIVLFFTLCVRDFNLDPRKQYQGQIMQKSFHVRAGEYLQFPCPELSEVVKQEGAFEAVYWSYCRSETCNTKDTEWSWMAGMKSRGMIKVNNTGRRELKTTSTKV